MALRPCTLCFQRFRGPAGAAYIAILDGGQRWEHKPKLCPTDYDDLVALFTDVNGKIDYDATPTEIPLICLVCHGDPAGHHPQSIFMTGYAPGGDRVDYFAACCASCRPGAERALRGRVRG